MENQIRDHLVQYLAGEATLEEFERWFVPATWDVERVEPAATGIVYAIQLALAEYGRGHLTEASLRRHLKDLAETADLGTPRSQTTASGGSTQRSRWVLPQLVVADRPHATASA